jgi:hypothetical protein
MTAALAPAAPGTDAFVDALLGLARLCGWLDPAIEAALGGASTGDATVGDVAIGAVVASAEPREAVPDDGDDLLDAVLGLASLRTTLSLVLGAAASELADLTYEPAASWSRELLR